MASQVVIDFKSIGEQIVTAIRSSIGDVSKELVAHTANQVKQEPQALDVRAQILGKPRHAASSIPPTADITTDNARALWPIIDGKRKDQYGQSKNPRPLPGMQIIAVGTGTTIRALVVRSEYYTNDQPTYSQRHFVFLHSEDTDTIENAQRKLLEMTMLMLNEFMSSNVYTVASDGEAAQ
ncbi:hypothetical protein LTR35_015003 [Friedmanniomyces endolithicus]|nr:hypothetical protein LTR35_015003 [Friedmanniomyces endolithicus]KAK0286565.1 hypothetical protein LTS00_010234 [Friedmanniomyces endolithicus]KAK0982980.1 hypothetical protein LTR54_014545 [Friedmanniomyces endolithicus]